MVKAIILAVIFGALSVHHAAEAIYMVYLAVKEYQNGQADVANEDH